MSEQHPRLTGGGWQVVPSTRPTEVLAKLLRKVWDISSWPTTECERVLADNQEADDRWGEVWVKVMCEELAVRATRRLAWSRTKRFYDRRLV